LTESNGGVLSIGSSLGLASVMQDVDNAVYTKYSSTFS
jgi:hypothetical protein